MAVETRPHVEYPSTPRDLAGVADILMLSARERLNEIPEFVAAVSIANFWKQGTISFTRGHQEYVISFGKVDSVDDPNNPKVEDVRTMNIVRFTPQKDGRTYWEEVYVCSNSWEDETNQRSLSQPSFIQWSAGPKNKYPERLTAEEQKQEQDEQKKERDNRKAYGEIDSFIESIQLHVIAAVR